MLGLAVYESSSENENYSTTPADRKKPKFGQPDTIARPDLCGPLVGPFQPSEPLTLAKEIPSISQKSPLSLTDGSLIRDMTLPPYPNLDIPPSPTGSSSPTSNKKFAHFLSLKLKRIHFNEKLVSSASLKNPSLFSSLRRHVGLEDLAQYATPLEMEMWDVASLPQWGYKENLQKNQQEISRGIEEENKISVATIDFVQALNTPTI
ncbi:hypothetical protein LOZ58_006312 [Ophidiomyces ophidiicola]|nr:hypothetical protein LOZ65_006281 [Ophidiomyces ophidiicola]KAI1956384.1 hypothetical protein LOZ58_006312 [Ophidiomyces ophidiicola]